MSMNLAARRMTAHWREAEQTMHGGARNGEQV